MIMQSPPLVYSLSSFAFHEFPTFEFITIWTLPKVPCAPLAYKHLKFIKVVVPLINWPSSQCTFTYKIIYVIAWNADFKYLLSLIFNIAYG